MTPSSTQRVTPPPRLTFHVALEASRLLRARERIRDYLRGHCDDPRAIDEIVLSIEEACTNAIRHSGATDDLMISLWFEGDDLHVTVEDHGHGFDVDTFHPDVTPDLDATGGRGLYLIACLMDHLELHTDGGLEVRMVKRSVLARRHAQTVDLALGDRRDDVPLSRIRALLEEIDEAFIALDWQFRLVHANRTALRLAGQTPDALLGRTLWETSFAPDGLPLGRACREAMELGTPAVLEYQTPEGTWLEARVYPTSAGVSVYFRDIRARKRRELERNEYLRALRRSEARYRSLFDSLQEAFCLVEAVRDDEGRPVDFRYLEANPAFERLLDATRDELVGHLAMAEGPPLDPDWPAVLGDVATTRLSAHHTYYSGTLRRHLELVAFSPSPHQVGVLVTDVTDSKEAEENLRRRTEELSNRVRLAESLEAVDEVAHSTRGIDTVMRWAIDEGMRALRAKAGAVDMRESGTWFVRYQRGFPAEVLGLQLVDDYAPMATRALRTGDLVVVPDVKDETTMDTGFVREHGIRAGIAAPLVARGEVIGCLLFQYDVPRAFDAAEVDFVRKLGSSVSLALENARLYEREAESARIDAAFSGGLLSRFTGRRPVRRERVLVVALAVQALYLTALGALPEARQVLGLPGSLLALTAVVAGALAGPIVGVSTAAFGGIVFFMTVADFGEKSGLPATLLSTGIWIASALLASFLAQALRTQAEKRRSASVALARSVAVREAQLAEQRRVEALAHDLRAEREQLRTIIEQTDNAVAFLDRDLTFALVNSNYARTWGRRPDEMIGLSCAKVYADEHDRQVFRSVRDTGTPVEFAAKPFVAADRPELGVTYWDWRLSPTRDDRGEVDGLVLSLVDVTERERARRLSDALGEINAAVSAALEPGSPMRTALRLTGEALECGGGLLAVLSNGNWVAEYLWNLPEELIGERLPGRELVCADTALADGRPLLTGCAGTLAGVVPGAAGPSAEIRCAIPLVVAGEALGALVFTGGRRQRPYDDFDEDFARKAGVAISQALENARLFAEQRRVATTLQEHLIHALPSIRGLEFGRVSRAAYEPELVGGDFSDVFVMDDVHVAALIGDVAGKGVRAAGLTETVHTAVTSFALVDPSPAYILRKTNELLLSRPGDDDQFVTAFLVVLDRRTGEAAYAGAGHPPPVLVRDGDCRVLPGPKGMALGTFAHDYSAAHDILQEGDCLVLYTDGVTEARRGGEFFGEQRLLDATRPLHGVPAQQIAERLRDEASAFAGRLRDDLQILTVRIRGPLYDQPLRLDG